MNPHSFTETLKIVFTSSMPELHVYTPVSEEDRVYPYVLLTQTADEERIPQNHTWECELEVQFHSNAYDLGGVSARHYFTLLCANLEKPALREALNESAPDFYLYRIALVSVDEPQAQDNTFIQNARFRVLIQF